MNLSALETFTVELGEAVMLAAAANGL